MEDLLRQLTPQVLGALTRRFGSFDQCEDALQESPARCSGPVVEGHLLEMEGDIDAARQAYLTAARRATSAPGIRYLQDRAALLARR